MTPSLTWLLIAAICAAAVGLSLLTLASSMDNMRRRRHLVTEARRLRREQAERIESLRRDRQPADAAA